MHGPGYLIPLLSDTLTVLLFAALIAAGVFVVYAIYKL